MFAFHPKQTFRTHPLRTRGRGGTANPMNVRIRSATAGDIRAMHRLRHRVRENRLSETTRINEASYRPFIAAGSAWVAEAEAGMIGFAAIDAPALSVWAL